MRLAKLTVFMCVKYWNALAPAITGRMCALPPMYNTNCAVLERLKKFISNMWNFPMRLRQIFLPVFVTYLFTLPITDFTYSPHGQMLTVKCVGCRSVF